MTKNENNITNATADYGVCVCISQKQTLTKTNKQNKTNKTKQNKGESFANNLLETMAKPQESQAQLLLFLFFLFFGVWTHVTQKQYMFCRCFKTNINAFKEI